MIALPDCSYGALERLKGTYASIRIATLYFDDKIFQANNFSRFYRKFKKKQLSAVIQSSLFITYRSSLIHLHVTPLKKEAAYSLSITSSHILENSSH